MAAFDTTRPTAVAPAFSGRLVTRIHDAFAALAAWNDKRVTRKSLSKLSARELDDIGLSIADVENMG